MSRFDTRESGPRQEAASKSATTPTNRPKSTRPTQFDRVLAKLLANDEVCGSELYAMYIPRFSAHIYRARRAGYAITKRPCDRHDFHEGTQYLYRLEALPSQLPGIGGGS